MSDYHQDANQTPAPARSRRGPAFSLNPFSSRSCSSSQFATPPRFQFPDEPDSGDARSIFRSNARSSQGLFRASGRRFDISSPLKGERIKPVQVSDDEIEDDFNDAIDTGQDDKAFTELDALFPISRQSNKRPRTSSPSAHKSVRTDHEVIDDDFDVINDSSPPIPDYPLSPPARNRTTNLNPGSSTPQPKIIRGTVDDKPSGPESFEPLSDPQTPDQAYTLQNENSSSSIRTASAFQNRPRFILSANYTPAASAATPVTSTPQFMRKKPTFVLPRSPSPDKEDFSSSAIPAPFSPVATRTLRRAGRPKSGAAATYVPGGMAEHLRDWIMEADMRRKAASEVQSHQKQNDARFATIGRLDSCYNSILKSSGPVTMAQMTPESARGVERSDSGPMAVLLLGGAASRVHPSNSRRSSTTSKEKLKPGDIIGIGAGLSWEIDVDSMETDVVTQSDRVSGHRIVPSSQSDSEEDLEEEEAITLPAVPAHSPRKKWLVAAEWDVLRQGNG